MIDRRLEVIYRPASELTLYERNARTHSARQIKQIASSISRFGFSNPVLIDETSRVIAGHGRLAAAKEIGMSQVPTIKIAGLTDDERRALILADNRIAMSSGWDEDLLQAELGALKIGDFDLSLLGFSSTELDEFSRTAPAAGLADENAAPSVPEIATTQPGDIWLLGAHRLMCGDSTSERDVDALLAGARPSLMVADPPYGVEYDAEWRRRVGQSSPNAAMGRVTNDHRNDWTDSWRLFPGSVAYVWHAGVFAHAVAASLESVGFVIRSQIIWVKSRPVFSRGNYHYQHEPAYYCVRRAESGNWHGGRRQSTTWFIDHTKSETGHSTQKPIECMRKPIENNSMPGQAVYDPFVGSGTTIIAAEQTDRCCYSMEIDPHYVDVAVRRWQEFSGEKAIRASDEMGYDDARTKAETDGAETDPGQPGTAAAQSRRVQAGDRDPALPAASDG